MAEAPAAKKPPQKLRTPNAYNLFVKEFFKSVGKLSTLMHMITSIL